MKAVILAGGQGTRLHPLTVNMPKPMVNLLGRPIMEYIVEYLCQQGFTDLLATLHHHPRVISNHFDDGSNFAVNLRYTLEKNPLGDAGSLKLGAYFLDETFLVIAGDILTDIDLTKFLTFHRSKNAQISLCLKRVSTPGEQKIAVIGENDLILQYSETPISNELHNDTVITSIYLLEPEILSLIPNATDFDFFKDLFPRLLAEGIPVYGYVAEDYSNDINTIGEFKQSHWDILEGKIRRPMQGQQIANQVWIDEGARVAHDAELVSPCWIGANAQIRRAAKIGPYSIICPDVEIDTQVGITRSIVMNNSFIGESSVLRNCIVGNNTILEAQCEIIDSAVIGTHCHLGRQVSILQGVLVWPDKQIDSHSTLRENLYRNL